MMSELDNFCIFILSHDRPDRVKTVDAINKHGYTGDYYIIVDDEAYLSEYEENYGEKNVIYKDKDGALPDLDRGDNLNRRGSPIYTRHQLWDLANELDYDYFMMMDDDYNHFTNKFDSSFEFGYHGYYENLDRFMKLGINFLEKAGIDTLAMAQGGDFIGGDQSKFAQSIQTKRKAMNTFLCKTENKFNFRGVLNDDVNTYVRAQQLGKLFLTVNFVSVDQEDTQQEEGGLTELYLNAGTYVKSFYTILYSPSCTKLGLLDDRTQPRVHHRISWRNAVPKIVPESAKNE